MRVLFVSSGNRNRIAPFVFEQGIALKNAGIELEFFLIKGKGITGYLKNIKKLKTKISEFNPDLLHAHFGLSGAVACMQNLKPKVVTFHGTDISNKKNNVISSFVSKAADYIITVNERMPGQLYFKLKKNFSVVSCGVDLLNFVPVDKSEARLQLGWNQEEKVILFASAFSNPIKNYPLAERAVESIGNEFKSIKIIELKDKAREEVNLLLNASDLLLVTSLSEGSPQIVKEAMACNCPIVSTDVGDVKSVVDGTAGCYITSFDYQDISEKIKLVFVNNKRIESREKIEYLSNDLVVKQLIEIYYKVLRLNL